MSAPAGSAATSVPARLRAARDRLAALPAPVRVALGLALLVAATLYLRTQAITAKLWIDEGLSVGIAHHDLLDIPGVLARDGSPPLYYMLLSVWMALTGGDGEARTHALSLLFATLTVPAGFLCARRLFGTRAGWATAALCATCPFLTYYAQETRMYTLVALLGLLASAVFAMAFALRERRAVPAFGLVLALLILTHNWGLFLGAGLAVAFVVLWQTAAPADRRPLLRDGLLGFGLAGLLYLPWVPTLVQQAGETGAPWAERPPFEAIINGLETMVGGTETALTVGLLGIAGLLTLRSDAGRGSSPRARAALAIGVAMVVGILLAWLSSQLAPAWAARYFAVFTGPALLLAGAGLVRFGRLGLVALAIVLALWFDPRERTIKGKSDAYRVARTLQEQGLVQPRDVVLSAHPEQGPLMRYYLGPDVRYADALGTVPDPRIFDWRNALDRLEAAGPKRTLRRIAPRVEPGQRLILIQPIIRTAKWGAPWTSLVRRRAGQWGRALDHDPRFQRIAPVPEFGRRPLPRGVRAVVYLRKDKRAP